MAKLHELKSLLDAQPKPAREPPRAKRPAKQAGPKTARPVSSPKRALGATKHAAADIDLSQAFADVTRLPPGNRADVRVAAPAPIPRQRIADEQDALLASKYGAEPALHGWEIGQEHEHGQTFVRAGLGSDVLTKLRRGHWALQGDLDLHGNTSEEARDSLADFLLDARARGARCVRVIHGKGLTSPGREPVLKGKVRRWLAQWDDVLAYCEAPQHAGGGGAVLVLLRGDQPLTSPFVASGPSAALACALDLREGTTMPASIRCAMAAIALSVPVLVGAQAQQPAAAAFDKLKSMAGDWIDVDGSMGMKDKVAASYRVTGGGNAVVETLFGGTPMEMTTVYYKDGGNVVLTHYCAAGNQPRMRAVTTDGTSLVFEFDGGSNLDPAKDGHMHNGRIDFVAPGLVKAQWYGWDKGKPSAHMPAFNLARKPA